MSREAIVSMKDGLLRRFIKALATARYFTDLWVMRVMLKRRGLERYELKGACEGCGRCCETPMMVVNPFVFRLKSLRWLFLKWHEVINGFIYKDEIRKEYVFIFECSHFDWETRQCDSYASRPGMCRDYPRGQLFVSRPELFPECGYVLKAKDSDGLREALRAEGLEAEVLAELEKKLHLGD